MADRGGGDWVRTIGTLLVGAGVSLWIIYAIGRYFLGWDVTDRDFLPYHLATILPGMVLRYHRFFFEDLPKRFFRESIAAPGVTGLDRITEDRHVFVAAAVIVNNFLHDLFTALWASSILVIYLLSTKSRSTGWGPASSALYDIMKTFFWIGIFSITVILATGGFRLGYYRARDIGGDREIKRNLLIVKHVFFTFVFIGGTYFAYLRTFK